MSAVDAAPFRRPRPSAARPRQDGAMTPPASLPPVPPAPPAAPAASSVRSTALASLVTPTPVGDALLIASHRGVLALEFVANGDAARQRDDMQGGAFGPRVVGPNGEPVFAIDVAEAVRGAGDSADGGRRGAGHDVGGGQPRAGDNPVGGRADASNAQSRRAGARNDAGCATGAASDGARHTQSAGDDGISTAIVAGAVREPDWPPALVEAAAILCAAAAQLDEYFAGDRRDFTIPLDWRHVQGFSADALRAVTEIPYGETAAYGEVAIMAGRPRAARAVGTACARSPWSIIVPVHRVVRADGTIGPYGNNPETKRLLIDLERQNNARCTAAH